MVFVLFMQSSPAQTDTTGATSPPESVSQVP
jgi:hypothetical protein